MCGTIFKGRQQAIETGRKFARQGLTADEILYSPLCRAADTARRISEITGIPARAEQRLIEQNFGRYESTPRDGREFYEAKQHCASTAVADGAAAALAAVRYLNEK